MSLRHGGLFEGYGGTTMAATLALGGLDTRWVSDIKPASVRLLAHHHPEVPNLGDMTGIDYTAVPPIDVLTASWPCQPHSSAGRRLGEADPRALWPHVHRAIAEARPAVFLGENVARITGNGELRRVVRSLAQLGYVGAWRCVRASDVDACHRRDRCFVVAVDPAADPDLLGRRAGIDDVPAGQPDAAGRGELTLLPTPTAESCRRGMCEPATAQARLDSGRRNVEDAIGALLPTPSTRNGNGVDRRGKRPEGGGFDLQTVALDLLPTPTVNDSRNGRNATAHRGMEQGHHHAGWTLSDVAYAQTWGKYEPAVLRHEQAFGRSAPAPTMTSLRTGNQQLAPAFVEWMMGLPVGHVCDVPGLTRNEQLSLLGDGVVPAQGAAAFRFLLDHLAQRLAVAA